MHVCVHTCKCICRHDMQCVCVCPFIGTYAWSRCNTCLYVVGVCLCKLCVCVCVSPSPTFQIRGLCNGSTKVRVFQWLGCSARLCLKVTTPHHCIISLPFHTSLSVWLIFKNKASPPPRLSVAAFSFTVKNGGGRAHAVRALWVLHGKRDVLFPCLWWWWWWWELAAARVAGFRLGSPQCHALSPEQVGKLNSASASEPALMWECKKK